MPVVVAVNGVAAGGGFSLAMAGDMIVAARSASFIQVFSRIAPRARPRLDLAAAAADRPPARARLMLLNEPLTAERAKEWGLVREVFDDDALGDGAMTLARNSRKARRAPWSQRGGCWRKASTRPTPSIPPRNRTAGRDPHQRRRAGRTQGVRREAQGAFHGTLRRGSCNMNIYLPDRSMLFQSPNSRGLFDRNIGGGMQLD